MSERHLCAKSFLSEINIKPYPTINDMIAVGPSVMSFDVPIKQ